MFLVNAANESQTTQQPKGHSGYLLKKGNKKRQGYHVRWVVANDLTLSYSKNERSKIRGVIDLTHSKVTLNQSSQSILIMYFDLM